MTKKNKISLNSTLIEAVVSQTIDIQEQGMAGGMAGNDYRANPQNAGSSYDGPGPCDVYKRDARAMARKIVAMDFEGWTVADTEFYEKYENEGVCGFGLGLIGKNMNEWIEWAADGEPGNCDNPWHCILPVLAVGALFISGPVGWGAYGSYLGLGLSITIEAVDAAIYWNEDEKQTAGLVLGLSLLPVLGKVVKKFPFVKEWGKAGSKVQLKFINGEAISVLENYQLKALKNSKTFIDKEILDYAAEKAARESIELAGQKVTKETLENAMKKGYMEVTVDGVTHKITKDMFNGLTQVGTNKVLIYTAKQQSKLITFGKAVLPYIIAGVSYMKIYDEVGKTGLFGPKDLIRSLWGIEPRDKARIKSIKFFAKVVDKDAVLPEYETNWEFIKTMFNADGSSGDGELMVQAIKAGWNPFEEGKGLVPKKYRTDGYKVWVENILSNKELVDWFDSDGSQEDSDLLLLWAFDNPDFESGMAIDEKYHTKTRKKRHEEEKAKPKKRVFILPDGTVIKDDEDEDYEFDGEGTSP
jgi:hypothetical protein